MIEGVDMPTWWQWWLIVVITANTVINAIVFFIGRKFKKGKEFTNERTDDTNTKATRKG